MTRVKSVASNRIPNRRSQKARQVVTFSESSVRKVEPGFYGVYELGRNHLSMGNFKGNLLFGLSKWEDLYCVGGVRAVPHCLRGVAFLIRVWAGELHV
jgi:hypothetical protein